MRLGSLYRKRSARVDRGRLLVWLTGFIFAGVVGGLLMMVLLFAFFARDLPSPDRIVRREGFATKIYDASGKLLYDVYDDKKRTPVEIDQMPLHLRQATIAIEDKNFYSHKGFDPLGIFRAVIIRPIFYRRLEGGSTLTQQLVKNSLLSNERTVTRKLKELILTLQVERKYSKDQILQMYLNEAPYGGTAYGVAAASETFFGKPVSEVNLAEAAILAGLPQSPTRYSPLAGTAYVGRSHDVLRRMREDGYITQEEEEQAREEVSRVTIASGSGVLNAPHFVFYVRQKLVDRYGEKVVEQGGLRVITTLDLELQEAAQKIVTEEINKVKHLKITNGAAMVVNPENGHILAMVGSRGWEDPDYDGKYNVTTALRQPGSAIKPVTYLTGLRKGYTAATLLMDTKTVFPGGDRKEYVPENYDGKFRGPMLVRESLGNSLNIPAVKMLALVGIENMLKTAYEMGLNTLNPTKELLARVGLSVTLGGGEVRLLELATAYSAFANRGTKVEPVAILKVTDSSGRVLEEWKPTSGKQVVSPEEAFIISSILSDPAARAITFGTRSSLEIPNHQVAVKTGTTNDKKDNWTIGWTPKVVVGVWVGNNDNTPMLQVASGVTGASPIWRKIIIEALKKVPKTDFGRPEGIVEMDVDRVSGFAAHDGFDSRKEFFIKGTEPTGEDPVHKKIKVCRGEGRLANVTDIAAGNYDEREAFYFKEEDPFYAVNGNTNKWQEGILNWLKDQADPKYHPPTELCASTNPLWISIHEPGDKARINGEDVRVRVGISDPNKVVQVEVYLDGMIRYTLTNEPWEITIPNVSTGKHKIDIKARDEKGFDGSRFVEFAVNQDWN